MPESPPISWRVVHSHIRQFICSVCPLPAWHPARRSKFRIERWSQRACVFETVIDTARLPFQKLPKLYPHKQPMRLSSFRAPRPRQLGITDLFHFIRIRSLISLITKAVGAFLQSPGAASFCFWHAEGEGWGDRLARAGPGGVLFGPGSPPPLPLTPKPGNKDFPLPPTPPSPLPGPSRWGRPPSG